jgi:hypothetical protein
MRTAGCLNLTALRGLTPACLALIFLFLFTGRAYGDEWNFTPADYGNLTAGGGDLVLDADSDWVPVDIGGNLLATLKKVLDPGRNPPSTAGVNVLDFFHGHVACPKPCAEELKNDAQACRKANEETASAALGGNFSNDVTSENLERFKDAKKRADARASELLKKHFKTGCVVIYHTYEFNPPDGMKHGDPRRNIMTPMGGEPVGYSPPDPDDASSWMRNYCDLIQIAFLIDRQGKVHVTTGSTKDLSKVAGSPQR